ncbi:hypothetical protein M758_4G002300 [Ceratodon purpureus]|nr:hypothetical protein M758_4G002300 [Ceratodon purpureus]
MMRLVCDRHTGKKQKRKMYCTRTSLTVPAQRLHRPSTRRLLTSCRCSSHKKQQNMAPVRVTIQMQLVHTRVYVKRDSTTYTRKKSSQSHSVRNESLNCNPSHLQSYK